MDPNFSKYLYVTRPHTAGGNNEVDSLYNSSFITRTGEVNVPCKRRTPTPPIVEKRRREEHCNSEAICRKRLEPEV